MARTELPVPDRRLREAGARVGELLGRAPSTRLALEGLAAVVDPAQLPPAVRERAEPVLERARRRGAGREPLAAKEVERVLRGAWGERPARVLDDLEEAPVAVTPTAQVHRAERDGRAVAVKVRRPGIADAVRNDLALVEPVARVLDGIVPGVDVLGAAREVRERVLDELDLEHEGTTQRAWARALRRHERLHVPAVDGELTHEDVLVHDWVEGPTLAAALAAGTVDDPDRVAADLVRLVLGGARTTGIAHADPEPANVLLADDGRLALVDFGAARPVDRDRVARAADLVEAVAVGDGDATALVEVAAALGWLRDGGRGADGEALLALARDLVAPALDGPSVLDAAALADAGDRALGRAEAIWDHARLADLPPEDLWPLRALGVLVGTLGRLGASGDWPALAVAALREGV